MKCFIDLVEHQVLVIILNFLFLLIVPLLLFIFSTFLLDLFSLEQVFLIQLATVILEAGLITVILKVVNPIIIIITVAIIRVIAKSNLQLTHLDFSFYDYLNFYFLHRLRH